MAGDTTPPDGATRYIETTRGLLSYSQLAPLLAERVLYVERAIASEAFAPHALDPNLLLRFHFDIANDLVPKWAGRWRSTEVRVGLHHPPAPNRVPILIKDYGEDLCVRLESLSDNVNDILLETLAFAEGRLLSIHPFTDFNGRVARLFCAKCFDGLNFLQWILCPRTRRAKQPTSRPFERATNYSGIRL